MLKIIKRYFTRHLHVIWLKMESIPGLLYVNIAVKQIIIEIEKLSLYTP